METNMRELKFRVWDDNGFLNNDAYCLFLKDGYGNLLEVRKLMDYGQMNVLPNAIMSQFTGLTDKNGVEIYEGDVVKATSEQFINENFIGKVIFDEGCFLTWVNKNDIRGVWSGDDIEVIGNIFENKDLLEKEH